MLTDRLLCIGVCTPDGITASESPTPPVVVTADEGGESALNCPFAVRLNFFYTQHHNTHKKYSSVMRISMHNTADYRSELNRAGFTNVKVKGIKAEHLYSASSEMHHR